MQMNQLIPLQSIIDFSVDSYNADSNNTFWELTGCNYTAFGAGHYEYNTSKDTIESWGCNAETNEIYSDITSQCDTPWNFNTTTCKGNFRELKMQDSFGPSSVCYRASSYCTEDLLQRKAQDVQGKISDGTVNRKDYSNLALYIRLALTVAYDASSYNTLRGIGALTSSHGTILSQPEFILDNNAPFKDINEVTPVKAISMMVDPSADVDLTTTFAVPVSDFA